MRAAADDAGWFVNVPASTVMVPIERSSSHEDGHVLTQQGPVPAWTATGGRVLAMRAAPGPGSMSLFVIYLTCVYLGCKIGDRVAYKGLLSAMLSALMKKDVTTKDVSNITLLSCFIFSSTEGLFDCFQQPSSKRSLS